MSDATVLAHDFLAALAANDPARYEQLLANDAGMRLWRWDGSEAYRSRDRLVRRPIYRNALSSTAWCWRPTRQ
jgi:hypothetical protein